MTLAMFEVDIAPEHHHVSSTFGRKDIACETNALRPNWFNTSNVRTGFFIVAAQFVHLHNLV